MKRFYLLLLLPFLFSNLNGQNTELGEFEFDGLLREYFVYLPNGYTPGDQLPLVFNMHGITSSNGEQYSYTGLFGGFNEVADTGQFIICYPNGTKIPDDDGYEWNVGFSFSSSTADDVGFINALIDTLHAHYDILLDRVYATGMSNGGYMAYKLACEIPHRFQAVASVTGSMVPDEFDNCSPGTSIPVMQIHNTADPVVLYDGSEFGVAIDPLMEKWRNLNFCSETVDTTAIPDSDVNDGSTVEKISWEDCYSNRKTVLFKINGGGHTWPGSTFVFAPTNNDINASREIWEFFLQYTEPIAVNVKELQATPPLVIAPNPAVDQINISTTGYLIEELMLWDNLGRLVDRVPAVNEQNYQMNLNHLTPGVYVLRAKTQGGWSSQKIIIQ